MARKAGMPCNTMINKFIPGGYKVINNGKKYLGVFKKLVRLGGASRAEMRPKPIPGWNVSQNRL